MSPVTRLLDGVTSSATVDIKMSGFYCAEGEQTDRPIAAFELSGLQVRPLFTATKFDFSTVDFGTSSSFEIPFAGSLTLNEEGSSVTGSDSSGKSYEFSVSVKDKSLVLNPKFSEAPADKTVIKAELKGICAEGAGEPSAASVPPPPHPALASLSGGWPCADSWVWSRQHPQASGSPEWLGEG